MSTLTVKELSAPTGYDIKLASGETLDLNSQGSVTMPSGSVLQVVSYENINTGNIETTSTTSVSTGISVSIFPKSASSLLYVEFISSMYHAPTAAAAMALRFQRDSTVIGGSYSGGYIHHSGENTYGSHAASMVATSNSTSSTTFEMMFRVTTTANMRLVHSNGSYMIKVTEIAG